MYIFSHAMNTGVHPRQTHDTCCVSMMLIARHIHTCITLSGMKDIEAIY